MALLAKAAGGDSRALDILIKAVERLDAPDNSLPGPLR
jgi:hypothetical protein